MGDNRYDVAGVERVLIGLIDLKLRLTLDSNIRKEEILEIVKSLSSDLKKTKVYGGCYVRIAKDISSGNYLKAIKDLTELVG